MAALLILKPESQHHKITLAANAKIGMLVRKYLKFLQIWCGTIHKAVQSALIIVMGFAKILLKKLSKGG